MFRRRTAKAEPAFVCRPDGEAVVLELLDDGVPVPLDRWSHLQPATAGAIAAVRAIGEDLIDEGPLGAVELGPQSLRLGPGVVARLDTQSAAVLGLPPPTRFALDVRPIGRIDQPEFRIASRWVQPGGVGARTAQQGALLTTESGLRRVPEPLWSLQRAAAALSLPTDATERFRALAVLQAAWPSDPAAAVDSDAYLRDIRVQYAAGMSLKLRTLAPDLTEFDPVLFSPGELAVADEGGLDEEGDSLLGPAAQRLFAQERFCREAGVRPVYVLRNGEYVYIDPALRPALNVVRVLQDAPEEERRRFILNPRRVLREKLGDELADEVGLERLFVETDQFSARVAGVDVWRAPVLPWLVPAGGGGWLPERFGLRVGDVYYTVAPENVTELLARAEAARANGEKTITIDDLVVPAEGQTGINPLVVPVNGQAMDSIGALAPFATAASAEWSDSESDAPADARPDYGGKLFLVVRENFEEVDYAKPFGTAVAATTERIEPPAILRTELKPHQRDGLDWLVAAHRAELPGVLLADDMGLGKTLQAMAFMAWRREEAAAGRLSSAPFLIIAPTGLLGTWRQEIERHLAEPGLGVVVPAFGSGLRQLREEDGFSARDVETGRAALDSEAWRDAGVVLTTYETMRDYHFSFARTRFGAVVFDEIQKLKNPASQVARAATALNSEFTIGMTGTPVENRLQDLWSIMDVVAPGVLGSSRDFERRHSTGDRPALAALKDRLCEPQGGMPALLLRRMKTAILAGLPKKHVHPFRLEMPRLQADAYRDVVIRAAAAAAADNLGKGGMLSALSEMRGISLHPLDPRQSPPDLEAYARDSARLSRTLDILKDVRSKREKALVFVEDLAMQERLAVLLQTIFGLVRLPSRISGEVPGFRRQQIVNEFQARPGEFDVLILSPRAGGVGLTITAANHVIHLSRWWNPAVEDQATDRVFRIGQEREVHVHLPMAVHPDPAIAPSSFDLRLDALIERKRGLTRDLFLPPDANDGDLNELFREVSLGEAVEDDAAEAEVGTVEAPVRGAGPADEPSPADEPRSVDATAVRPVLSVPKPIKEAKVRVWLLRSGDPRPTDEIAALFQGKTLAHVKVSDPYCMARRVSREAQVLFLRRLADRAHAVEALTIEYSPDIDGDVDDAISRREIGALLVRHFPQGVPRTALNRRRRTRVDDFHDRFVTIEVRGAGGAIELHAITIGRGIEALFEPSRECNVTYVPPSQT